MNNAQEPDLGAKIIWWAFVISLSVFMLGVSTRLVIAMFN